MGYQETFSNDVSKGALANWSSWKDGGPFLHKFRLRRESGFFNPVISWLQLFLCEALILHDTFNERLPRTRCFLHFLFSNECFSMMSLIGSYSQCPLIISEISEFHWSKLKVNTKFQTSDEENPEFQIKISKHLFSSMTWFITHKILRVKMTCNCSGNNYCCFIVYVANDTNNTVQQCNYLHRKHLPTELTISLQILYLSEKYYRIVYFFKSNWVYLIPCTSTD